MSAAAATTYGAISADSHTMEPPWAYKDYIDPKYRDDVPYIVYDENLGDAYVIKGFETKITLNVAAAGVDQKATRMGDRRFEDVPRGGWDTKARLEAQDRDGIAAEIVYPTIGMVLCGLTDNDYKHACMWAYNRWLQEFAGGAPNRIFGIGQTAVRSVEEAVEDLKRIKEMGFKGVMIPSDPGTVEDYDHPSFDPLWRTAVELDMPVSFHILTGGTRDKSNTLQSFKPPRGPVLATYQSIIRGVQDIIAMFLFGGVFDRHPDLKVVLVESDAGWAPHWTYRADHAYHKMRYWSKLGDLKKLPSERFFENVYLTFGDDWPAMRNLENFNARRLMWANDFPHQDGTWPKSQELIHEHMKHLPERERAWILRDNVSELYHLDVH